MTVTTGPAVRDQLASSVAGVAWFVEMDFASGTQYLTSFPVAKDWGGHTYTALGSLAAVGSISESEAGGNEKLKLTLSIADQPIFNATLGNVEGYRGRAVRCRMAVFDARLVLIGNPVLRFSGVMDKVAVKRSEKGGSIEMQCSRVGMARSRNVAGLRLSSAQQQARFPGDLGLDYIQSLINTPAQWLSKRFQER